MDTNIALADLASGRAVPVGAKCRRGVHTDSPLLALLESVAIRSMSGPPFALQASLTTVSCGATVGEPPSAEIRVSHMPALKAKKLRKLPQEEVLLEP